jgi:hypothetical protein
VAERSYVEQHNFYRAVQRNPGNDATFNSFITKRELREYGVTGLGVQKLHGKPRHD